MAVLLIKSSAIVNASENEEAQVPENTGAIEQESYLDSGRIDVMEEDNIKMCEHKTGLKVLACIEKGSAELDIVPEVLQALYD